MIIKFWDRSEIVVSEKQWLQIKHKRDIEGATWIELKKPFVEFDPRTIAKVVQGGLMEADIMAESHRIPARIYNDEDHRKARAKVAEIRKRMFNREVKKSA